jgi:hypothetical protein
MNDFDLQEMTEDASKTARCINCVYYGKGSSTLVAYAECRKKGEPSRFDEYCRDWSTVDWESLTAKNLTSFVKDDTKEAEMNGKWKVNEEEPIEAKVMVEKLIYIYEALQESFRLKVYLFKNMSGRKRLEDAFLDQVDLLLRTKGYVLVNLRKEEKVVGIVKMSIILDDWKGMGKLGLFLAMRTREATDN